MNERMICIPLPAVYPGAAAALGNDYAYMVFPFDITVVAVSVAPDVNDADLTLTIEDHTVAVVGPIDCAVAATPGTWESTHVGGANTPVVIAKDSKISLTATLAANATQIVGHILALTHENA